MQRIDPASDRAVYRQIADNLRLQIERGEYRPGDQLPSESQIVAEYEVSRVTAQRALGVLDAAGLATAKHGRGWFVHQLIEEGEAKVVDVIRDHVIVVETNTACVDGHKLHVYGPFSENQIEDIYEEVLNYCSSDVVMSVRKLCGKDKLVFDISKSEPTQNKSPE